MHLYRQLRDAHANYGMCFSVVINRPECSLLGGLWSKHMFGLIVDININIQVPSLFFKEYIIHSYILVLNQIIEKNCCTGHKHV